MFLNRKESKMRRMNRTLALFFLVGLPCCGPSFPRPLGKKALLGRERQSLTGAFR
jgi:hypothetical protein